MGDEVPARAVVFVFNDTATAEIYTLSLHDALPISHGAHRARRSGPGRPGAASPRPPDEEMQRSEEHTSELQSHVNIVCRLLLEKKKQRPSASLSPTRSPALPPTARSQHTGKTPTAA